MIEACKLGSFFGTVNDNYWKPNRNLKKLHFSEDFLKKF